MNREEIKTLYQYTTVERAASTLLSEKIYSPHPRNFNDSFDCEFDFNPEILPEDFVAEARRIYAQDGHTKEAINKIIAPWIQEDGSISEDKKREIANVAQEFAEENSRKGVLCLTEDPLSPLMWAHYGARHHGVCLGFSRVEGSLLADDEVTLPVQYSDDYPQINFVEIAKGDGGIHRKLFCSKAKDWAYEKEWRLLANKADAFASIPGKICEVILGCRIGDDDQTLINDLCTEQGVPVSKCEKISGSFEFGRKAL